MDEYDLIADGYATDRDRHIGVSEVTAFAATLRRGARVLEIGCGTGIPLTRALLEGGCEVVAIDSSAEMIARFRWNLPQTPAHVASILACDFPPATFDGALAWGVLFHLSATDQARAIASVATVLTPGGRFLFTAGGDEGTTEGRMHGVTFRYTSLSVEGYRGLLRDNGLTLLDTHADRAQNTYYLAEKRRHSWGGITSSRPIGSNARRWKSRAR